MSNCVRASASSQCRGSVQRPECPADNMLIAVFFLADPSPMLIKPMYVRRILGEDQRRMIFAFARKPFKDEVQERGGVSLASGIGRRFDVKQFYCPRAATVILQVLLVKTIGGKAHRSIDDCFASWLTLIQEREAPRPEWRSCTSFPSNAVGLGSVRRIHFNGEVRMCDTLQVSALRACKQHLHCTVEPHPARENVARPPLRIKSRSKLRKGL
jgi:hypothetical protein